VTNIGSDSIPCVATARIVRASKKLAELPTTHPEHPFAATGAGLHWLTCVTLNHDAGVPRELISSITGHEPANIDAVLAHYTARTADQATTALNMRVAHEAKSP